MYFRIVFINAFKKVDAHGPKVVDAKLKRSLSLLLRLCVILSIDLMRQSFCTVQFVDELDICDNLRLLYLFLTCTLMHMHVRTFG